jgi:hypothetical protein
VLAPVEQAAGGLLAHADEMRAVGFNDGVPRWIGRSQSASDAQKTRRRVCAPPVAARHIGHITLSAKRSPRQPQAVHSMNRFAFHRSGSVQFDGDVRTRCLPGPHSTRFSRWLMSRSA